MTNSSGIAYRYYVPAGNNTVVYNRWGSGSNSIDYVTKDNLGSSAVITDHAGALVVKEKFSALGWNENTAAEEATMATVTRHEFTGHEGLDNAGLWLVNMNGRIYSPFGSCFFSPDPKIPDPTNTLSYNRYAYTNYNPLTYVDPTGFDECDSCETVTINSYAGGGGFENAGGGGNNSLGRGDWSNLENWAIAAQQNPQRIDPYLAHAFDRALSDPAPQQNPETVTGGDLETVTVKSPYMYTAARLEASALFIVWASYPGELLPTLKGFYQINNAPCYFICIFRPSQWQPAQSPYQAPIAPLPPIPGMSVSPPFPPPDTSL
jgi:RHS repeat-associated protein